MTRPLDRLLKRPTTPTRDALGFTADTVTRRFKRAVEAAGYSPRQHNPGFTATEDIEAAKLLPGGDLGGDPYRASGPTPRIDIVAARARYGWRSFWRHRADEYRAFAKFMGKHSGLACVLVVALVSVATVGGIGFGCATMSVVCVDRCEEMGANGSLLSGDPSCYCLDENGKPWRWREWPGVEATDGD